MTGSATAVQSVSRLRCFRGRRLLLGRHQSYGSRWARTLLTSRFRKYALKHTVQLTKPFIQRELCFRSDLSTCGTHVPQPEHYKTRYIEQILQQLSLFDVPRTPIMIPRIERVNQGSAMFQQYIKNF